MNGARIAALLVGSVTTLSGCQPAADQSASAAQAIRAADSAWAQTFARKDLTAYLTYVDSSISLLPPDAPMITGVAGLRDFVQGFLHLPALTGTWHPTRAEASRSGDLGYSMGTYQLTYNDPSGRPTTERGKYASVWRKQANGSWRVVLDMFNSDLPAAGTAPH